MHRRAPPERASLAGRQAGDSTRKPRQRAGARPKGKAPMFNAVSDLVLFCRVERRPSDLTCKAHERDVRACIEFLRSQGVSDADAGHARFRENRARARRPSRALVFVCCASGSGRCSDACPVAEAQAMILARARGCHRGASGRPPACRSRRNCQQLHDGHHARRTSSWLLYRPREPSPAGRDAIRARACERLPRRSRGGDPPRDAPSG